MQAIDLGMTEHIKACLIGALVLTEFPITEVADCDGFDEQRVKNIRQNDLRAGLQTCPGISTRSMTIPALVGVLQVLAIFSPSEENFVTDITNAGW